MLDASPIGVMSASDWIAWQSPWRRVPWSTSAKAFAGKSLVLYIDGDGNVSDVASEDDVGSLTLKCASSGAVAIVGKFAYVNIKTGKVATYSASCSTMLIPAGNDAYRVYAYFPAKTTETMDFGGFAAEIPLKCDGKSLVQ